MNSEPLSLCVKTIIELCLSNRWKHADKYQLTLSGIVLLYSLNRLDEPQIIETHWDLNHRRINRPAGFCANDGNAKDHIYRSRSREARHLAASPSPHIQIFSQGDAASCRVPQSFCHDFQPRRCGILPRSTILLPQLSTKEMRHLAAFHNPFATTFSQGDAASCRVLQYFCHNFQPRRCGILPRSTILLPQLSTKEMRHLAAFYNPTFNN